MLQINQVLDTWFNRGFKGLKCKTLLKLASSRIKLLKNKRAIQLKQLRRELAQLLENGQESMARIRVEHIIREQNIMDAYDTLEHFCELLIVRMPIMESQRECPLDLKEAIASLIFAAPRASDLPELQEVQTMLSFKYGQDFVASATELRPDCGVNRLVIEKLSARAPTARMKLNLMKEIVEEHNIEWDPASTELEFLKAPQDLLDGPNQFIGPIQMSPIPCHEDDLHAEGSMSAFLHQEDEFSLPSPPMPKPSALIQSVDPIEEPKFVPFLVPPSKYATEMFSGRFYSPPRESSITQQSGLLEETLLQRSHSRTKSEGSINLQDIIEAAEAAAESAEKAAQAARAAAELARSRISLKSSKSIPHMLQTNPDLPSSLQSEGSGNTGIHLTPDSYDWTQQYSGKKQQENENVLLEQRVDDEVNHDTRIHLTQDSYDWTRESYGRIQQEDDSEQENDSVLLEQRVDDEVNHDTHIHLTQDSYDWVQESYKRKQQEDDSEQENDSVLHEQRVDDEGNHDTHIHLTQDSYDWTQESYKRKQLEDGSVAFHWGFEGKAQPDGGREYFDDYGEGDDDMSPLHHGASREEVGSISSPTKIQHGHDGSGNQPKYDAPRFDGPEKVTHAGPFERQPSLEDDPYFSYPNLFSKPSLG